MKGTPDPSKWTKILKYNLDGLLAEGIDARGVKTAFAYDGLNRVASVTYTGETGYQTPTIAYTYDQTRSGFYNHGALTRVETTAVGETMATATEFDYDLMGRVVKHRQTIGTNAYNLEYGYNLAGQLTSQKYPSGKVVATNYDANGRLASIADAQRTYLSGLQYQGKGNSMSAMTLGNGTTETFTLNDRLQMTGQELKRGSEVLQKYDYGYGQIDGSGNLDTTKNNGQLAQVESWIGSAKLWTQKFRNDHIGRLKETEERRGDTNALSYKQTFDFDRFGNMYRKAANNNPIGQETPLPYTPIEDTDISKQTNRFTSDTSYDEAGNVIADNKFRVMGFAYDANGRMVKATRASVSDAISVYDAAGLRVAEKINDVWRYLIYDIGGKLVAEYGGPTSADEGGVKYVLQDWQGSTRATTNNTGFVKSRTDYTAFGEDVGTGTGQRTTQQGFGGPNSLRQKYGLTERDDATGLDHTWFRKFENQAGRWTSPDPYNGSMSLGDPQSFNRYSYVNNQPTNFVDPSGLLMLAPQRTQSWLEICWIIGMCGNPNTQSQPGEDFPGGGSGGGGGGAEPLPSEDPCDGKKGRLNYDAETPPDPNGNTTARDHIDYNHIRTDVEQGKSKYWFSIVPSAGTFAAVTALNQATFRFATGYESRGNIAYVYAVPKAEVNAPGLTIRVQAFVGKDATKDNQHTNVNTLIVSSDCKTVITSYPGLPGGMTGLPGAVWVPKVPFFSLQ